MESHQSSSRLSILDMYKSRSNPAGITIEHLWLAAPFFVILLKGFRVPLPLLDFWWHLKMGEIIFANRSIPRTDLFSYTAGDQPFIVQNWLSEIAYYVVHRLGGLPLLIFFNAVALSVTLLFVYFLCRESTHRPKLAALSVLLACLAFPVNARPQVFSFAFFALFYWILDGYRFQRRDRLWLLPLIMIVWVNVHGAFAVGLGLIAIFFAIEFIRYLANSETKETLAFSQLMKLGIVFVVCIAATLLNPETYKVYEYIHVVLSDRASQQLVMEWQPPQIDSLSGFQMFFGLFGLAVLGLIYSRRRINLMDLALFLSFAIFGLTALRNTVWFVIIIAPLLTRYWAEFSLSDSMNLPKLSGFFSSSPTTEKRQHPPKANTAINFILVCAALLVLVSSSPWTRQIQDRTSLLDPQTPVNAVNYIEEHALQAPIFHPQIFGDYLIWRLYPKQRSFIDGRVHLFGEDFVREYRRIFSDSHWEEKLESFHIQYLLLSKHGDQADSIILMQKARSSEKWSVLFEDDISILFTKEKS